VRLCRGLRGQDSRKAARGRDRFWRLAYGLARSDEQPIRAPQITVESGAFDLEEIAIPLHLFHGEQDPQVPVALARRMLSSLPTARLNTYPEDGHLSTFSNHIEEIAEALTRD